MWTTVPIEEKSHDSQAEIAGTSLTEACPFSRHRGTHPPTCLRVVRAAWQDGRVRLRRLAPSGGRGIDSADATEDQSCKSFKVAEREDAKPAEGSGFSMNFKAANRNIAAALGVFSVSREDACLRLRT